MSQKPPPGDDDTDYVHRNTINLAAIAFLLVVALALVWTVNMLDERRKLDRCVSSGRKDCVQVQQPPRSPIPPARQ